MHRVFTLHPHKHTGKLMHHRHTSYPILVGLIVIVGIVMCATSWVARADDLFVSATVPAPLPSDAPAFTSPVNNSVIREPAVTFKGTCPVITPAIVIALYEGTTQLGSSPCLANGTFSISVSLSKGVHVIVAKVVTITNQTGASSQPLTITYQPDTIIPPTTPGNTPGTPSTPGTIGTAPSVPRPSIDQTSLTPLDITSSQPFTTYTRTMPAEWTAAFSGGNSPYDITINWGDGKTETRRVTLPGDQTFTHNYGTATRNFTITVTVRDATGQELTRSYASMYIGQLPKPTSTLTLGTIVDAPIINPYSFAYIVYLCLLLMMLLMWRYEHIHYPRGLIGLPHYYDWQYRRTSQRTFKRK